MPIEFVKCRRTDNPTITEDIAVSALPHLSGWERIPEEEIRAAREAEEAARLSEAAGVEATKQPPAPPEPTVPGPPIEPEPAKKSRSRAATDK